MKVLKGLVEFATFCASMCCLSGIDAQMWQAVPGILLLVLLGVELKVWEDECVEW